MNAAHAHDTGAAVLRIEDVTKFFGGLTALDRLSLETKSGEILGLVGPNGAGKSVMINVVTGFYPPSSGTIRLGDFDITGLSRHRISRLGVARTFQNIRLFRRMTVLENVLVANKRRVLAPLSSAFSIFNQGGEVNDAMRLLDLLGIADLADTSAGALSYGDARRLEIARALASSPRLLLLDEPAAGMNDEETASLIADIRKVRGMVESILLVEHHMTLVRELCDRIVALESGRRIAEGSIEEVFRDPEFVRAYLGLEGANV